jgi:glyoxylate utilization-related uncharacterized protein
MRTRDLTDLVRFADDAARAEVLAETGQLWSQVICLQGNQGLGPMRDAAADGLMVVLAGEVAAQVGKTRARMRQWHSAVVPAGEDLTVRNASDEPSVVLLVLAPPPAT